jgi:capsular exopolysaccharide synthesis family protein
VHTIEGKTFPALPGAVPQVGPAATTRGIAYWQIFRAHLWLMLTFAVLGTLGGFIYCVFRTPVYSAASTVELLPLNQSFMGMSVVDPEAGTDMTTASVTNIQTQIRILTSRTNRARVIERLNLEGPLAVTLPQTFFTKIRQRIPIFRRDPLAQTRDAMTQAAKSATAKGVGATRLIDIQSESASPQMAAQFVNTLAQEYIAQTSSSRSNVSQKTSQWMESQLEEAKAKMEESGEKLRQFVQQSGMDFFPEQTTLADSQMKLLQGNASAAEADRIAKQAKWELVKTTPVERLPDVLTDGSMQSLKAKANELKVQIAQLTATLTPEHYKVQRIQAELNETQDALEKEEKAAIQRAKSDYDEALNHEKLLLGAYHSQTRKVSSQADKAAQYSMLKRDLEMDQTLYAYLSQHSSQASLVALAPTSNIRVVDMAAVSRIPTNPVPERDIPVAGVALAAVGYGLLILREASRRKKFMRLFEAPGHTTPLLRVPELGVIPSVQPERNKKKLGGIIPLLGESEDSEENLTRLVPLDKRSTLQAESFRQTLVSILRTRPKDHNPIYVLTSAGPGEGKTTLSVNLATAMAEIGHKVLLVDVDVRRSHMDRFFGSATHKGLTDLLVAEEAPDDVDISEYTQPTAIDGLEVMSHGIDKTNQPGLAFFSPKIGQIAKLLQSQYDCVFFDTSPALLFPDARLWGKYSDGVLLVVRAGVTTREDASAVCQRFVEDGIPVLGTILNDWTPEVGYDYGYYSYKSYVGGASGNGTRS